jgi:hypothetical protein
MTDPLTATVLTTAAITAAATKLSELVIETGWKEGGGLFSWANRAVDAGIRQRVFAASQKYIENYRDRHCLLKVLGMRKPVELESVYTAVRFLDNDAIQQFTSVEALESAYRERQRRQFEPDTKIKRKGIEVANAEPYLMVLGAPGAGKSTFLRKIGLEALKGKQKDYSHRCIPVLIELKRFTSDDLDVESFIVEEFQTCGFPDAKRFTSKALNQGRLLILLDGLDEIPTANVNRAIDKIQDFVDRYSTNRYIASCRIAAYRSSFRRFTDVAMADFDDEQIQQFIHNWFQSEADRQIQTAEKCWEVLQKPENKGAKELAHTPLLLTFLCLVYDRAQTFPSNRSLLYRKALRILLEEWAAEKRILRDEIYEGLSTELEEILLSEIAYQGFEADRLFFPQREIVENIKTFLAGNLNAPVHLNGESVLQAIVVQQGILVERAEDTYSFSHLTLQEYLTAQYIDDHRRIEPLVQAHLTDKRWREIFLLVAGLMRSGADDFLLLMEKQAQACIQTSKLQALLHWATEITEGSKGNYKPAAKRVTVIYLVRALVLAINRTFARIALPLDSARPLACTLDLNLDLDLAHARARDFDITYIRARARARARELDLAIARACDLTQQYEKVEIFQSADFSNLIGQLEALKSEAPDDEQPDEVRQAFTNRILHLWFQTLHLNPKIVTLSEEEVIALNHYFYINELMVRCKEAAVRVSPQVWAEIEDRIAKV